MQLARNLLLVATVVFPAIGSPASPHPSLSQANKENHIVLSPSEREHIFDGEYKTVLNVDQLPQQVKIVFAALAKQAKFEMANPGDDFQLTDVITQKGLPQRRLIFADISTDKCIVHYEKGGYAHVYYAVVFSIDAAQAARFVWGGAMWTAAKNLTQLRSAIKSGIIKDDLPYIW
jgi:hypothetical protein